MTPYVLLEKIEPFLQIYMVFHFGQKMKDDLLEKKNNKKQKKFEIFCVMSKDDISLSYKFGVICGLKIKDGLPRKIPPKGAIS